MMSWALLIYMIDVLSTDGEYVGWSMLFFLALFGYVGLTALRLAGVMIGNNAFFPGMNVVLTQPWRNLPVGTTLCVGKVDYTDNTMTLFNDDLPFSSGWVKIRVVSKVTGISNSVDILKPIRNLCVGIFIASSIGIGYASFMPKQETAYKMLAAYVGQTVVTDPRVQETAGNALSYLNKAIKKYEEKLDAPVPEKEKK